MDRNLQLHKAFQRGHLLNLNSLIYRDWLNKFIIEETKGDFGIIGDITSDSIINSKRDIKTYIKSRSNGILAGMEEITFLLKNHNIKFNILKKDRDIIKVDEKIIEIIGNPKNILRVERSVLDILQRMSGISTLTDNLLTKIKNKVPISPTRKTQWRYLDKKAAFIGGALTHRLALWDAILIKDNHILLTKKHYINYIEAAIKEAWKNKHNANFIEIEVRNEKEALDAAKIFKELNKNKNYPCLIMLDNIPPKEIKNIITKIKSKNLHDYSLFEASGGINPKNIVSYSNSGVDVISMGYLTHSPKSLDFSMVFI